MEMLSEAGIEIDVILDVLFFRIEGNHVITYFLKWLIHVDEVLLRRVLPFRFSHLKVFGVEATDISKASVNRHIKVLAT